RLVCPPARFRTGETPCYNENAGKGGGNVFAERLGKLLGDLFGAKPKYITVPVSTAAPAQALPPDRLPRHVAIIMDGNGRWANARNLPRTAGHAAGTEALRDIIRASDD